VVASNAYPLRKPEIQVLCPGCGDIFASDSRNESVTCPSCDKRFCPNVGTARGAKATCQSCSTEFSVLDAVGGVRPSFRLYGKLVLTAAGDKEYLRVSEADLGAYKACSTRLAEEIAAGTITLPSLGLEHGYNTKQAISYGFREWKDFFNDRQLLALGWLRAAIERLQDESSRSALMVLFSGALEFNNVFTSYKGEGTGAVRHMFAHHILKPERVPIEANLWGTAKSSGSFTGLFRGRLLRAIEYRQAPTELSDSKGRVVSSQPFSGLLESDWPTEGQFVRRGIYVSCGDSAQTDLPSRSIDLVVTDPPFFDNVHYSELADFFYAWQGTSNGTKATTRHVAEVQDSDAERFSIKLQAVFKECCRVLKDDGLLVFTYHHSRPEGWSALAKSLIGSGFAVVNAHPVKAEMSVATPKAQAKEPIQIDIVLVCRKHQFVQQHRQSQDEALVSASAKIQRMRDAGFQLSKNDERVIVFGQLLATVRNDADANDIGSAIQGTGAVPEETQAVTVPV
jgi:putative DNA methylase